MKLCVVVLMYSLLSPPPMVVASVIFCLVFPVRFRYSACVLALELAIDNGDNLWGWMVVAAFKGEEGIIIIEICVY